ncbi:MAG: glycosyltransferase [Mobilitalea sp.]
MRIMVFDVPAESGGALTILNQYYEKAKRDFNNEWIFIISTPDLAENENLKVLNFRWVKKSWLHRFYFDNFVAYKLVKQYQIDEILSLQNVIIKNVRIEQILYLHQPLPFVKKRYGFIENYKFWIYQNIISRMIYRSIEKAFSVIVQTKWMKDACIEKTNVNPDKIIIEPPCFDIIVREKYEKDNSDILLLFYPAAGASYKNHKIIVEALNRIDTKKRKLFKVIFTLKGNENANIKELYDIVEKNQLPIDFIGQISSDEVYNYYAKSTLIFPSYIETFGLPLLEAKLHGSPILASDCAFSHEVLEKYDNVKFFDPFDVGSLLNLIEERLN